MGLLPDYAHWVGGKSPRKLVRDNGLDIFFDGVAQVSRIMKSRPLALAHGERWWDMTHTFHFLWAELTITPTDFTAITGLPFRGWPLI